MTYKSIIGKQGFDFPEPRSAQELLKEIEEAGRLNKIPQVRKKPIEEKVEPIENPIILPSSNENYWEIPHEGGSFSVQYPAFKGNFGKVFEDIEKAGLGRLTSAKTASLIYEAFQNPEEKYSAEIISILKSNWFWEPTVNLYLPKSKEQYSDGVILDLKPIIENGKLIMDKKSLIERLEKNDSNVKFVPFGYKIDQQSCLDLEKNPYIIARYGEEGAEKIAKIADKCKKNPKVWSFDSVNKELVKTSALYGNWDFDYRLNVDGNYWYGSNEGHSFGVRVAKQGGSP